LLAALEASVNAAKEARKADVTDAEEQEAKSA